MRCFLPGLTAIPLVVFSGSALAVADAPPVVSHVLVDGVAVDLPTTILQAIDGARVAAPGVYRVVVDTSTVLPGQSVDVVGSVDVAGQAQSFVETFQIRGSYKNGPSAHSLVDPLLSLSDPLDDSLLSPDFDVVAQGAAIAEGPGGLTITPADNPGGTEAWFNATTGPRVTKLVTNNFRATSLVRISNAAGTAPPPDDPGDYQVGGLIMYDPDLGAINSFHGAIANFNGNYSYETKTTANSVSTIFSVQTDANYAIVPAPGATFIEALVRICRTGQIVATHFSVDGGVTWVLEEVVDRSLSVPFPPTLAVGMMAYVFSADPADMVATFPTGITFETLGGGFAPACV